MIQVWKKVRDVDSNDSEAVKDVVTSFFQNVTKIENSNPIKWLRMLGEVINRFPKYCTSHRSTIEGIVTASIDSNDYYYVVEAAKCAQAVQQVRPSQEKTATPKTSWQDQMTLLCNAAHLLITGMFPNAVDMYKDVKIAKNKELSLKSSLAAALENVNMITGNKNKSDRKTILQTRLRNVFCFIQAMLVEVYPVAKPVRPQAILDVIVRALSVSSGSKNLSIDVSVVKIEALRTLDALIACLGPNLIPFSPLVFRLLMQTLRWTSDNGDHDFSKVRSAAYSSLGNWLNTLHTHRSAADSRTSWEDELTNHILRDTAPTEKVVQLTMGPQPTKNMSKKAKRKLANAKLLESSIANHIPGQKNKNSIPEKNNNEVTMAALECAETFLLVCGRFLKPTTHKLLQERVLRESYNAHNYTEELLISLLRVAEATRKTVPSGVPPPTQHCMQIYSSLINTPSSEISKFCTQALLDIRMHLHCSPPSLNFALEAPQQKETSTNKRKKISKKNREALENLLGRDKMPEMDDQEDVISIPDEPASKKKRLDHVEDKISVSSDSISSVEISDDSDIEEIPINEKDDDNDEEEEIPSNNIEIVTVTAGKTNKDNNSLSLVDKNTNDQIKPMNAECIVNVPIEENLSPKPVSTRDIKDTDVDANVTMHSELAEVNDKSNEITVEKHLSIHEAPTQIRLNVSTDTIDGEDGPLSLEVGYDYPNTGQATVNILNKMDDETLPSTNDTDDVMITCGQFIKSSQEVYLEKKSDDADISEVEVNDIPKTNDIVAETDIVENGMSDKTKDGEIDKTKVVLNEGVVSIEDMMADFVDEVNEDITVT